MTRIPIVLILLGNIVSCDLTVRNMVKPLESVGSNNVTRKEGEHVSFHCGAGGAGSVVVWRRGYAVLSTGEILLSRDLRLSVGQKGDLHISSLSDSDSGEYVCQVTSLQGDVLEEVHRLRVVVPATVTAERGWVEARLGERVRLRCSGRGVPAPSLHWYKSVGSLEGEVGCDGGCLTVSRVSLAAGGDYICSASNGVGLPAHATIQLTVLFQPRVTREVLSRPDDGAKQVSLECQVTGEPRPSLVWYREDAVLNISGRLAVQETEVGGQVWSHVLNITGLLEEDYGNYSCLATNKVGRDRSFIELHGRPSTPTVSAGPPGQLAWSTSSLHTVDMYRVLLRKENSSDWLTETVAGEEDSRSYVQSVVWTVRNVSEGAGYDCIVQAHNRHGWSLPSTIYTYRHGGHGGGQSPSSSWSLSVWRSSGSANTWCCLLQYCYFVLMSCQLLLDTFTSLYKWIYIAAS